MQATKFVDEYFSLWNQYDAKGIADLLDGNGYYFDQPKNTSYAGQLFIQHLEAEFTGKSVV